MSKADVKKYIKSLDKSSLEELVLDLYSARKEAKDYLEYVIKPNDKGKLEEYREVITKEFFPNRGEPKMRFSVCRKAVSEFKSLDPAPEFLADLMLYIPECASEIANDWGDMWEQFYDVSVIKSEFITACIYTWVNLNLKLVFFLDRILVLRCIRTRHIFSFD